jgi:hypothetical protein
MLFSFTPQEIRGKLFEATVQRSNFLALTRVHRLVRRTHSETPFAAPSVF